MKSKRIAVDMAGTSTAYGLNQSSTLSPFMGKLISFAAIARLTGDNKIFRSIRATITGDRHYMVNMIAITDFLMTIVAFALLPLVLILNVFWCVRSWCGKHASPPCKASTVITCKRSNKLSDFSVLKLQANTGTTPAGEGSGSATWTDVLFGTAGYELRAALSGGSQTTSTASASWPSILKPASGTTLIDKMYAFSADTTGLAVTNYDGTTAHYLQFRINWDNTGTHNSAPIISAWKDNTLPAASPGTQNSATTGGDGSSIINGTSGESGSFSLLKANAYGQGLTSGGSQQTPAANAAGTETVNGHSGAGAATPSSAAWLSTWQDLQAATNFIQNGGTPQATTAGLWYLVLILRIAAGMTGGTLLPILGFQYTWI